MSSTEDGERSTQDWPAVPATAASEMPPPDVLNSDPEKGLQVPAGALSTETTRTASHQTSGASSSETTLTPEAERKPDIYDRFTRRRKYAIVAVVSYSALLAPFASSSFLPSIPTIASDLHTSGSIINYTVAIYLATTGIAPLPWALYARFYGRRTVYLMSLPLFCIGSLGVALSSSLAGLIMTRIVQGIGASSVLSVGAGSIGDIYRPTERGRAMGLMYGGALFGPTLSPVVAGILTEYVPNGYGWRAMQWLLCAMGALASLLIFFFLPETAHSRGLEEERARREKEGRKRTRFVWVWLDPLKPLRLLRYMNVLAISFTSSVTLLTTYTLIVPLTYTIGPRYNISNAALLGCLYLAPGIGNMIGSRIGGIMSDRAVKKSLRVRNGVFRPEDRLRACLFGSGLVLPLSVLVFGIVVQFWPGVAGLVVAMAVLVVSGFGLMIVLGICNTYLVDALQSRSTEVIAANNCLRYIASAGASAAVLPLIEAIGIAATNAIAAVLAWIGFGLILLTIKYGDRWREKIEDRVAAKVEATEKAEAERAEAEAGGARREEVEGEKKA